MTQQDDITQRLRDNADIDEAEHGNARVVQLEREAADEIERLRAELSTLRAPVADEQDRNATISQVVGLCNRIPGATTWNAAQFMYDEMHRRATLASAPVAVEHPDGLRTLLAELPGMRDDPKKGDAVFRCGVNGALDVVADRIRELLRSAPVAGEAQPVAYRVLRKTHDGDWKDDGRCWCDGAPSTELKNDIAQRADRWRIEYAYASPQASAEDAIMASDDVAQLVAFIFDRFGQPGDAGALPDNVAAAVRRLERGIQPQADKDGGQQRAGDAALARLAEPHTGMRVDYQGLLRQAREGLHDSPGLAEMLRQLQGHLRELGQRWYAGDTAVVDELLQLYCVESNARAALSATQAKQGERDA